MKCNGKHHNNEVLQVLYNYSKYNVFVFVQFSFTQLELNIFIDVFCIQDYAIVKVWIWKSIFLDNVYLSMFNF